MQTPQESVVHSVHLASSTTPTGDVILAVVLGENLSIFLGSRTLVASRPLCQVGRAVTFLATGTIVAVAGDSKVIEFFGIEYQSNALVVTLAGATEPFPKRLNSLAAVNEGGACFAVADKFGDVFALTPSRLTEADRSFALQHMSIITVLSFSPNGQHFVSCDSDCHLRVSKATAPANVESFLWTPPPQGVITCASWSIPSGYLLVGTDQGNVAVWNLQATPLDSKTGFVTLCVGGAGESVNGIVPLPSDDGFIVTYKGSRSFRRYASPSGAPTTHGLESDVLVSSAVPTNSSKIVGFCVDRNGVISYFRNDAKLDAQEGLTLNPEKLVDCDNTLLWRCALGAVGYGVASKVLKAKAEEGSEEDDEPQKKNPRTKE